MPFEFTFGPTEHSSGSRQRPTFFHQSLRAHLRSNRGLLLSKPKGNIFGLVDRSEHLGSFGSTEPPQKLRKQPCSGHFSVQFLISTKGSTTRSIKIACITLPQSIIARNTSNWHQYTYITKNKGLFIKIHPCTARYKNYWNEAMQSQHETIHFQSDNKIKTCIPYYAR